MAIMLIFAVSLQLGDLSTPRHSSAIRSRP